MPYSGTLWYNPLIQLAHYYKPFFKVWNKTSAIYLFSASLIHQQYYHDHWPHFGVPGPIFSTINSSLLTMTVTYHCHVNCLSSFRECLVFCNFPLTISTMYQLTWMCPIPFHQNCFCLLVCHAEMNAILNKNAADIKGCSIYVALFPCNECTKLIIQAGIKEVIFYSDKYHNQPICTAARKLLDMAGIKYR